MNWTSIADIPYWGVIMFLLAYILYRAYRKRNIDKGLDKIVADGAVILDLRTKSEFNAGHIKNAVNIPLSKLRIEHAQLNKDQSVITYCSHGLRSIKAKKVLLARGFTKVYNGGGMSDLEKNLPSGLS